MTRNEKGNLTMNIQLQIVKNKTRYSNSLWSREMQSIITIYMHLTANIEKNQWYVSQKSGGKGTVVSRNVSCNSFSGEQSIKIS